MANNPEHTIYQDGEFKPMRFIAMNPDDLTYYNRKENKFVPDINEATTFQNPEDAINGIDIEDSQQIDGTLSNGVYQNQQNEPELTDYSFQFNAQDGTLNKVEGLDLGDDVHITPMPSNDEVLDSITKRRQRQQAEALNEEAGLNEANDNQTSRPHNAINQAIDNMAEWARTGQAHGGFGNDTPTSVNMTTGEEAYKWGDEVPDNDLPQPDDRTKAIYGDDYGKPADAFTHDEFKQKQTEWQANADRYDAVQNGQDPKDFDRQRMNQAYDDAKLEDTQREKYGQDYGKSIDDVSQNTTNESSLSDDGMAVNQNTETNQQDDKMSAFEKRSQAMYGDDLGRPITDFSPDEFRQKQDEWQTNAKRYDAVQNGQDPKEFDRQHMNSVYDEAKIEDRARETYGQDYGKTINDFQPDELAEHRQQWDENRAAYDRKDAINHGADPEQYDHDKMERDAERYEENKQAEYVRNSQQGSFKNDNVATDTNGSQISASNGKADKQYEQMNLFADVDFDSLAPDKGLDNDGGLSFK